MDVSLRPATQEEFAFCESLSRRNMGGYLAARKILWDPDRFLASWAAFENLMIVADSRVVGLLRLAPEQDALGLRDLQIIPEYQGRGIGNWAVRQAQSIAASRGFRRLRLRVYTENPAGALYARAGFKVESVVDGTIHMACDLSPGHSFKPNLLQGAD
ncbi:MAG TPA: GNAT family N-acetyltransferase [Lysobacter sp.]|nr:GNAT family N-acetyltransferase [Lysobacter sp.]